MTVKKQNTSERKQSSPNSLEWAIDVPIFYNRFILEDLGLAIGIPFGILLTALLVIGINNGFHGGIFYALGLIGMLFLLTYIFVQVVYGGKYAAAFVINDSGIRNYTQTSQAKRNKVINMLTVILGILARKPAVSGAGLLAQSKQSVLIRWQSVTRIKYYPKEQVIVIRGGLMEKIALFCTQENYHQVEAALHANLHHMANLKR